MKIYLRLRILLQNIVLIKGHFIKKIKNSKCVYTEQQSFDINEAKTDKIERINGKMYNYNKKCQYFFLNNQYNNYREIQQEIGLLSFGSMAIWGQISLCCWRGRGTDGRGASPVIVRCLSTEGQKALPAKCQ